MEELRCVQSCSWVVVESQGLIVTYSFDIRNEYSRSFTEEFHDHALGQQVLFLETWMVGGFLRVAHFTQQVRPERVRFAHSLAESYLNQGLWMHWHMVGMDMNPSLSILQLDRTLAYFANSYYWWVANKLPCNPRCGSGMDRPGVLHNSCKASGQCLLDEWWERDGSQLFFQKPDTEHTVSRDTKQPRSLGRRLEAWGLIKV